MERDILLPISRINYAQLFQLQLNVNFCNETELIQAHRFQEKYMLTNILSL